MARLLPFVATLLLAWPWTSRAAAPGDNLSWLKGLVSDGALLSYSFGDTKLYLTELSTGDWEEIASNVPNGWSFEFSPDSSKLAWIEGTTVKGRMRKGDTIEHVIATGVDVNGGVHWVNNNEVVYVKAARWRRASIDGQAEVEVPKLTALGSGDQETDVKLTSKGVWCYVARTSSGVNVTWKTSDGKTGDTGGTCSSSFSPEINGGISSTGLLHAHKEALLNAVIPGAPTGSIHWNYDYEGDKGFDNHRWSSNHADFVVVQDEKANRMTVLQISSDKGTWMGPAGSAEMYGDFTVGSGTGDPWPGAARCGNDKIEQGETCDPIASCPTDCDDGNACTRDTLEGVASECTATCVHSEITACAAGDGCCPAGCDSLEDSDCSASCGNDSLEEGETCDPPSSCPQSCDDSDSCTDDLLTGSAENCSAACSHRPVTACKGGDGCCPPGCGITTDNDCESAALPDAGAPPPAQDADAGPITTSDGSLAADSASPTSAAATNQLSGGCNVGHHAPLGLPLSLLCLLVYVLLRRATPRTRVRRRPPGALG